MDITQLNLPRDKDGFLYLRKRYSELWQKTNYLTKEVLVVNHIYEYDIKSANVSALSMEGFNQDVLAKLTEMPKDAREKAVGKMIRSNKEIDKIIRKWIKRAREFLFRENLIQDSDVVAIKNDAVFTSGRKLTNTTFGYIEFRIKNHYSAYLNLDGLEIYYNRRKKTVDIKGIRDDVLSHMDHQNGILQFIVTCMEYLVTDRRDALRRYLIEFSQEYKSRSLPICYYREMNSYNIYRTVYELSGYSFNLLMVDQSDIKTINIQYNYNRFVLPMIRLFI